MEGIYNTNSTEAHIKWNCSWIDNNPMLHRSKSSFCKTRYILDIITSLWRNIYLISQRQMPRKNSDYLNFFIFYFLFLFFACFGDDHDKNMFYKLYIFLQNNFCTNKKYKVYKVACLKNMLDAFNFALYYYFMSIYCLTSNRNQFHI